MAFPLLITSAIFRCILCCQQGHFLRHLIAFDKSVLQENPVERICQRLQCLFPYFWLQFTFPDGDAMPPHSGKFMLHPRVPLLIPPYLCHPKIPVRLRNLAALRIYYLRHCHVMPMPEAAVHEDTRPVLPHHDVWLARQARIVPPVAKPIPPQPLSHHHFRLRVLAVDGSHVSVALRWEVSVGHKYYFF